MNDLIRRSSLLWGVLRAVNEPGLGGARRPRGGPAVREVAWRHLRDVILELEPRPTLGELLIASGVVS
jgi:hypothetical protein